MVNGYELANFVLFAKTPGKLIERLKKEVIYIEAAGGLVRNQQGQYLFIFRHGKWDLPKGKLEAGETPAAGGIRDVEEECGITIATLGTPLAPTWHAYVLDTLGRAACGERGGQKVEISG